jgi:hypothetical protein
MTIVCAINPASWKKGLLPGILPVPEMSRFSEFIYRKIFWNNIKKALHFFYPPITALP